MFKLNKKIIIILIGFLVVGSLVWSISNLNKTKEVQAGTDENVFGWAWSENIGWISFNSTNCDANEDGFSDGVPSGCPSAGTLMTNYGVQIESDGMFSGYAWSENIGWISFAPSGPYPAAPNFSARFDLNGTVCGTPNQICGWARALAPVGDPQAGGWDGWIKLKGPNYEVRINEFQEFEGWAWGGDDFSSTAVIGWISFNCNNPETPTACSDSDYKVKTSFMFNQSPQVQSPEIEDKQYCGILTGQGSIRFKWTYQDGDNDNESRFDFRVNDINNVNDLNYEVNRTYPSLNNPSDSVNTQYVSVKSPLEEDKITFDETYYWWSRVWDNEGNSGWVAGPPVTTDDYAWPWPDFIPSPQNPSVGQVVEFVDISECYNASGIKYDCKNGAGISYAWDFDYDEAEGFTIDSTYKGNATTTYPISQPYTIMLRITDGFKTCSTDKLININFSLPGWIEVSP